MVGYPTHSYSWRKFTIGLIRTSDIKPQMCFWLGHQSIKFCSFNVREVFRSPVYSKRISFNSQWGTLSFSVGWAVNLSLKSTINLSACLLACPSKSSNGSICWSVNQFGCFLPLFDFNWQIYLFYHFTSSNGSLNVHSVYILFYRFILCFHYGYFSKRPILQSILFLLPIHVIILLVEFDNNNDDTQIGSIVLYLFAEVVAENWIKSSPWRRIISHCVTKESCSLSSSHTKDILLACCHSALGHFPPKLLGALFVCRMCLQVAVVCLLKSLLTFLCKENFYHRQRIFPFSTYHFPVVVFVAVALTRHLFLLIKPKTGKECVVVLFAFASFLSSSLLVYPAWLANGNTFARREMLLSGPWM